MIYAARPHHHRSMPSHKRLNPDREITFNRPSCECFACYDSGIVQNSDGMVNRWLPDYDRLPNGQRMTGSDCALVCHCKAAYPEQAPDGTPIRGGYREGSGEVRSVNTDLGIRYVGADFPKEAAREIHKARLESWRQTEEAVNAARRARATGEDPKALPWFIAEVRETVMALANANRDRSRAEPSEHRLVSVGEIIGQAAADGEEQFGTVSSRAAAARAVAEYEAREREGLLPPAVDVAKQQQQA